MFGVVWQWNDNGIWICPHALKHCHILFLDELSPPSTIVWKAKWSWQTHVTHLFLIYFSMRKKLPMMWFCENNQPTRTCNILHTTKLCLSNFRELKASSIWVWACLLCTILRPAKNRLLFCFVHIWSKYAEAWVIPQEQHVALSCHKQKI